MSAPGIPTPPPRKLACARCGAAFDCSLSSDCWCAEETFRLPVPAAAGDDCLCPACLRRMAHHQHQEQRQQQ